MKYISMVLLMFMAVNISSCSDVEPIDPNIIINPDPEPEPNPTDPENPVANGLFKVDIDGVPFSTSTTLVYLSGGSVILNAIGSNGDTFAFLLDGTTPGSYAANDNIVTYTEAGEEFGWWGTHPTDNNANTGSVIITSVNATNNTISGTFSFTGYWSDQGNTTIPQKTFTNGSFTNLPYVTQSPTNDTFFAKVNGAEFVETDLLAVEISIADQEFISVGAEDATTRGITVSTRSNLSTGSYQITGNVATDPVQIKFSLNEDSFGTVATSGHVKITEKTADRIKGTFSASVTINSVVYQITDGAFDVAY
ncbi:MAG TPA: DUF6252 family protein [Flavobacterium sp.]|jgi:hypothetical protein